VAFRCLPYFGLDNWRKLTENLRPFDNLKEVPHQYFSFLGQVISEYSHKDSVKLLVEDMIQECNLRKLAFDPRATWILATVLRSKEPTHLRIVARWCIRRLGSLMVHTVGVNLAISVLERLVDLNEPEFSVIRSHMLGLLVTKLTDLNKDEVESLLDFDKLLDDNEVTDKEPLIIKAAKDNVAHRFVMEVYKYLEHLPSEARDRLEKVYTQHAEVLKADRIGCLVQKSKSGYM